MALYISALEANRVLAAKIRVVFVKHHFDLNGNFAENFGRFEQWAGGYRSIPDEETLAEKLVEFGVVRDKATVNLLIEELAGLEPNSEGTATGLLLRPRVKSNRKKSENGFRLVPHSTRAPNLLDKFILWWRAHYKEPNRS